MKYNLKSISTSIRFIVLLILLNACEVEKKDMQNKNEVKLNDKAQEHWTIEKKDINDSIFINFDIVKDLKENTVKTYTYKYKNYPLKYYSIFWDKFLGHSPKEER